MRLLAWLGVTATCSTAFLVLSRARRPIVRRIGFTSGIAAIAILVLLGPTWPSVYTIVALACLPCAFLFLVEVVRPSLADRRWVRAYGTAAVILASASLAYQTLWDIMGAPSPRAAHGSRPLLHRPGPRR